VGLVLTSLTYAFNLSSVIFQISGVVIGVVGMVRHYMLTHRIRFNDEEGEFLEEALPPMDSIKARRFLHTGSWATVEPDTVLTEAGLPAPNLVYLMNGSAQVRINGTMVATIEGKSFTGDVTALTGDPATATVIVNERSRCIELPAEPLRNLVRKDADMRRELDSCLSSEVKRKLVNANAALSANDGKTMTAP
jgi:CRP-like cAMP-binding protein